jgi:hypothetical protein
MEDKYQGKKWFEIDLSSKYYPSQKIVISSTSRMPLRLPLERLLDCWETSRLERLLPVMVPLNSMTLPIFGNEWQVLPSDDMLFHDVSKPQFPDRCIAPEDPRSERRRRPDESSVSEEQAEAAFLALTDPAGR